MILNGCLSKSDRITMHAGHPTITKNKIAKLISLAKDVAYKARADKKRDVLHSLIIKCHHQSLLRLIGHSRLW